jgi:hypothetical protein
MLIHRWLTTDTLPLPRPCERLPGLDAGLT